MTSRKNAATETNQDELQYTDDGQPIHQHISAHSEFKSLSSHSTSISRSISRSSSSSSSSSSLIHRLSTNPYVVYPLMIGIFVSFQLFISFLFTGTLSFGLFPSSPVVHVFSPSELSKYDGSDPSLPIYLGFLGDVFDVTSGSQYYGPNSGYHIFAGRDGTRAFLTGCFNEQGATHDLRGLTEQQLESIRKWHGFYKDHKTYKFVGTIQQAPIPIDQPLPDDNCK